MTGEQNLMEKLGAYYEMLDTGCCGLAGSFGFEDEHYDISMQIGEHKFYPATRGAEKDTILVADGFSCKTQLEQGSDRRALYISQVIKMAKEYGEGGVEGEYPERGSTPTWSRTATRLISKRRPWPGLRSPVARCCGA